MEPVGSSPPGHAASRGVRQVSLLKYRPIFKETQCFFQAVVGHLSRIQPQAQVELGTPDSRSMLPLTRSVARAKLRGSDLRWRRSLHSGIQEEPCCAHLINSGSTEHGFTLQSVCQRMCNAESNPAEMLRPFQELHAEPPASLGQC